MNVHYKFIHTDIRIKIASINCNYGAHEFFRTSETKFEEPEYQTV
jgi:hypothetical protein